MRTYVWNPVLVLYLVVAGATAQTPEQTPLPTPAAASPAAATNAVGPKIRFESEVHDFGKITAGGTVRCDFVFTNAGDALLEINGVVTTCGCTTAGEWPRQVEPGKTGKIPIEFHAPAYGGAVAKIVTVNSSDKERQAVYLQIKGTVWRPVEVNPQFAIVRANAETLADARASVHIVNNEEQPLVLSAPEINNGLFTAELKTNQPGKEFELSVRAVPTAGAGNRQSQITLRTSSTNEPVLNITAMAVVQPVLAVTPSQINLPRAPLPGKMTYTVSVGYSGTNVMVLSDPAVNVKDVTTELKELQPGRAFSVAVSFPAGFELEGGQTAQLSVKSNHPDFPVIKVSIAQPPRPVAAALPSRPAPQIGRARAPTSRTFQALPRPSEPEPVPVPRPPPLPGAP
jgi:hypothetical protein